MTIQLIPGKNIQPDPVVRKLIADVAEYNDKYGPIDEKAVTIFDYLLVNIRSGHIDFNSRIRISCDEASARNAERENDWCWFREDFLPLI